VVLELHDCTTIAVAIIVDAKNQQYISDTHRMKKESCENKGGKKKGRRQLPEQGNRRCEDLQDLYCSEHQVRNQFWRW
jgi:hypothetical protein